MRSSNGSLVSRNSRIEAITLASRKKILDPRAPFLQKWNKTFVWSCVLAVSFDVLFFYIPVIDDEKKCLGLDEKLQTVAIVLRSFCDLFYMVHIIFHFHTGYIVPSLQVSGRGELVRDASKIAGRYLRSYFFIDILAVLPLPQVVVLAIIPRMRGSRSLNTKKLFKFLVLFQLVPRVLRVYPLHKEATISSGMFTANAWSGAAFNLLLYMLASHVLGAFWYLFSLERETTCWEEACGNLTGCVNSSVDCNHSTGFKVFLNESCPIQTPNAARFDFGIFLDALQSDVVGSKHFLEKFLYCFWWGLQNLSSLGQNLNTSTFFAETIFAVSISTSGLVLFALLIGNMQKYLLLSTTTRMENWRKKMRDAEQWMSTRLLPTHLRERIKQYEQYRWQETRGVDEEELIRNLPKDLRRDIKRHLGLGRLKKVPLFERMDDQLLDALCGQLERVFFTEGSFIMQEGDPVDEMLFVMDGRLASSTTNGGRIGFFNVAYLKRGDFCGEEVLTWALVSNFSANLPISTRTVQALSDGEAFALKADAWKFVAPKFRTLLGKQFRHVFKFYSQQWRTWAACFIQAAWRRFRRRKMEVSLRKEENRLQDGLNKGSRSSLSFAAIIYAARFAVKAVRVVRKNGWTLTPRLPEIDFPTMPQKLPEPDFIAEDDVDEETVAESDSTGFGATFEEVSKGKYAASSSEVPAKARSIRRSSCDADDHYKLSAQLEELAVAIKKLTDDRVNVNDLYQEVMKTEGFNELTLAKAFDHLVENEMVAKGFMAKNARLRRAWLEDFINKKNA